MTLLEDLKALAESMKHNRVDCEGDCPRCRLVALIARHEHDDWRGSWKCEKCGFRSTRPVPHYENDLLCTGTYLPYERRKGERRKA